MKLLLFSLLLILGSCSSEEQESTPAIEMPVLSITDARVIEGDGVKLTFELRINKTSTEQVSATYQLDGVTAEPGVDYMPSTSSIVIPAGESRSTVTVDIINDEIRELSEIVTLNITDVTNATIDNESANGTIEDNDRISDTNVAEDGYFTTETHFGYNAVWSDEFQGNELNPDDYNFELGDGCDIDLCGWGNNELQSYTSDTENILVQNDMLTITATQDGSNYSSARITTKDKQKFKHGRIDIRAKLPEGQGIWPAIWMLGQNIDEVGWPACGEIDIMELVGHQASAVHGTAHWGNAGNPSTFVTGTKRNAEVFSKEFHVFTLDWTSEKLTWYIDEEKFHEIERRSVTGVSYPFNEEFFLIFNVAVGGNWPGSPDSSTQFPQRMDIDYIRVFQLK